MNYKKSVFRTFTLISQLGISIVTPVLLCTFLGAWLEERVPYPVFIPLLLIGILAGVKNAYHLIRQIWEADERESKENGRDER